MPKQASKTTRAGATSKPKASSMYVRLKPYNPRRGYLLKKYTHVPSGKKFEESLGWCRVDPSLAAQLREIHQNPRDDETPFAFDVCTEAEAKQIDASERKAKQRRESDDAHDLTTSALSLPEKTPVDERRAARAKRNTPSRHAHA